MPDNELKKLIIKVVVLLISLIGTIVEGINMIITVIPYLMGTASASELMMHLVLFIVCSVVFTLSVNQ